MNGLGDLGYERAYQFGAYIQHGTKLTVSQSTHALPCYGEILDSTGITGKDLFYFQLYKTLQCRSIDTTGLHGCHAVGAEAEAKEETNSRAERYEAALMVVAVIKAVVTDRFEEERLDTTGGDVTTECLEVGAHIRVGRAEACDVGVAKVRMVVLQIRTLKALVTF